VQTFWGVNFFEVRLGFLKFAQKTCKTHARFPLEGWTTCQLTSIPWKFSTHSYSCNWNLHNRSLLFVHVLCLWPLIRRFFIETTCNGVESVRFLYLFVTIFSTFSFFPSSLLSRFIEKNFSTHSHLFQKRNWVSICQKISYIPIRYQNLANIFLVSTRKSWILKEFWVFVVLKSWILSKLENYYWNWILSNESED
jgi:hypothetical protein